jgi:hypothetical protein
MVIFLATAVVPLPITGLLATLGILTGLVAVGTPFGDQLQAFAQSVLTVPVHVMVSVAVATWEHWANPIWLIIKARKNKKCNFFILVKILKVCEMLVILN